MTEQQMYDKHKALGDDLAVTCPRWICVLALTARSHWSLKLCVPVSWCLL